MMLTRQLIHMLIKKYSEAMQEAWNNFKSNPVKKLEKEFDILKEKTVFG